MALRSSTIINTIIIGSLKGLSLLPFWIIYSLSDFLSVILQYVVGYRRKVIRENMRRAFPEKSEKEIRRLMRRFYVHFCDISLETAKAWSMTREDFAKRVTIKGTEEMNRLAGEGKSVVLLAMHYNNWEWSSITQAYLKHQYLVVYNPVRGNPKFEEYLLAMREKFGAKTIPFHKSARTLVDFHRMKIPICLALGGDQRPPIITPFWTTFLNQEACFNSGPEKIAKRTNQPVFFFLTRKVKRGHYEIEFIPLIEKPSELSHEDILLTYVRTMEKYIMEAPEYYLWSHKRWKQKRPEGYELYL
jgi:Kdo2-lipid IVA lauroyltransferase/acyltransferase